METIKDEIVIKMYLDDQLSVAQISGKLTISSSKVRHILDKNHIAKRSISDAITSLNITKFNKIPFLPKDRLSREEIDLKITGIMLYWGEGAKTGSSLKLANSNPEMIRVFLLFLRNICGVYEERIKILIHMYPDHDKDSLQFFWSSITGIKLENFYKPQILQGKRGTYKTKSVYGAATIHYSDKKLLQLILRWIDEYKDSFLRITPP
jgi:hypothetical protein